MRRSRKNGRRPARSADYISEKWSDRQRKNRRELGQNFLKDKQIARRIVEAAGVGKDDLIVEFGAGGGMLTRQLARVAREVIAVEYDPYWAGCLTNRFSADAHVRVVHEDALKVRLPREPFGVVANIPFNITTSLLHRLLDDPVTSLETVHLLVQKQVAFKHTRPIPTTLKTLTWSPWYEFTAGLELPAGAFYPRPEVDACLMVAAKRDPPLIEPSHRHLFRALAYQAFNGNGNSVRETLKPYFTRTQLRRLATDNGFSLDSPPSMLPVHQWARVFDSMIKIVPPDRWPSARSSVKREALQR